MVTSYDLVRTAIWARELGEDEIERARRGLTERQFPKGAYICHRGDRLDYWTGVITGLVKISAISRSGKAMTFAGVGPGGWFGEGSMLKDEPRRYDGVALRDSRIAYLPHATFQWLLDTSIAFNRYLLIQLNERLGQFIGTVEIDRLLGADARVARCLAQLFNPLLYPGLGRKLEISQGEIGYLTGLSRQRVNQALRRLEDNGLLKIDYGAVTVLSVDGLRGFEG